MDKLYSWSSKRAGGRITIKHATGKIVNVDVIEPINGKVVAIDKDGRSYELVVAPPI
ncbi:hypothetical protein PAPPERLAPAPP_00410 [Brevundimonas phage vB_BpoS-Papperlapapp]|nr:hypothetical protein PAPPERLAPAPP_00410 [Brevundimonas phage vB_BpoS-Papperlapapp]